MRHGKLVGNCQTQTHPLFDPPANIALIKGFENIFNFFENNTWKNPKYDKTPAPQRVHDHRVAPQTSLTLRKSIIITSIFHKISSI